MLTKLMAQHGGVEPVVGLDKRPPRAVLGRPTENVKELL